MLAVNIPLQKMPGSGGFVADKLRRPAFKDHAAAVVACARAHIYHMIGDAEHIGVVLQNEHGVAFIAQPC